MCGRSLAADFSHRQLCLSKISKYLRGWSLYVLHNSRRCPFLSRHSSQLCGRSFVRLLCSSWRIWLCVTKSACFRGPLCKTPEIDLGGPPAVDLNVPVVRQNSVRLQNQQDTVRLRNIATIWSEDTGSLSFLVRTGRGQAHWWLAVTQNACYTYFT
jgi:hypothetical protein